MFYSDTYRTGIALLEASKPVEIAYEPTPPTVLAQPYLVILPALWAALLDQWRQMGYFTDSMTLRPMPLERAKQADRYAEVIGPWVFSQEWAEVGDTEDGEMNIVAIKTRKITPADHNLFAILDDHLLTFADRAVLAVTSKVVALCQGRVVKVGADDKQRLIESEADYFLPPDQNRYHVTLTIKDNILIPSAGIDESNSDHHYVLWPRDPQQTADTIRAYLCRRFDIRYAGVIITDSKTTPLRWGVTGVAVAHSGFLALNDYVGRTDLFGRTLRMTKVNVADALAAAAVLVMGEGDEQTPLAMISDVPFVQFQDRNPTEEELQGLRIAIEDDLYAPLLKSVEWRVSSDANQNK